MRLPPVLTRTRRSSRSSTRAGGRVAQVLPSARLGGPMPWVIAIMVALCVLAAGGALALANFAARSQASLDGGLTVQILEADPAAREAQARIAMSLLRQDPGIATARRVPDAELARLVEPWLGEIAAGTDAIALPALIDARLAQPAATATLPRLRAALARGAPAARIDAQGDWLGPAYRAISALRWLAVVLIALLTLASAAAVWLAARNAFDANRETIEIVHHLGAGDAQIAGLFQRAVATDAIIGGGLGLALGVGVLGMLGTRFAALDSSLVDSGSLGVADWLLVALVPAIMLGVALLTARRTVMTRLGRML